ncbi:putative transcription factor Trihelix family [Lupinus albus]|uniref:Putative transcription factor Trihelix family n=1 Tax=Lupinus albus TaxID=3870 RepID=A0A6A4QC90_LUPAL|nr:putative transcription factor Trihelix family [Lupinus albus]
MASSSSSPTEPSPPFAIPLLPPPPTTSRRLPPPCWSPEETSSLIHSYRHKWYSLSRTNLKASHWQEVADAVTASCPNVSPPKTAVQCRHKMEKLRKRYRAELQRAMNLPVKKFNSAWLHFNLMDSLEKGSSSSPAKSDDEDRDSIHANSLYKLRRSGIGSSGGGFGGGGGGGDGRRGEGGFRIPSGVSVGKHDSRFYPKFSDEKRNPNFGFGGKGVKEEGSVLGKRDREKDPVEEIVNVIKVLADGFMRTEQMKMEMAREIERMRIEREMKRTEMILDSQHRIVEAFANAVAKQRKKTNQVPSSPES